MLELKFETPDDWASMALENPGELLLDLPTDRRQEHAAGYAPDLLFGRVPQQTADLLPHRLGQHRSRIAKVSSKPSCPRAGTM